MGKMCVKIWKTELFRPHQISFFSRALQNLPCCLYYAQYLSPSDTYQTYHISDRHVHKHTLYALTERGARRRVGPLNTYRWKEKNQIEYDDPADHCICFFFQGTPVGVLSPCYPRSRTERARNGRGTQWAPKNLLTGPVQRQCRSEAERCMRQLLRAGIGGKSIYINICSPTV